MVSVLEPGAGAGEAPAAAATALIACETAPLSPGLPIRMSTFTLLGATCVATTGGVGAVGAVGATGVGATAAGGLGELAGSPSARAGDARPSARAEIAPAVAPTPTTRRADRAAWVRNRPAEACFIHKKYPVVIPPMQTNCIP